MIIRVLISILCLTTLVSSFCESQFEDHIAYRIVGLPSESWYTVAQKDLISTLQEDRFKQRNEWFYSHKPKTIIVFPDKGEEPCGGDASGYKIISAFYDSINSMYRDDVNTLIVDYLEIITKKEGYDQVINNVPPVGRCIGEMFKQFISSIQPEAHVHLIGVGLGAQIMAFAAKAYGTGRLRLTGLDPAYKHFKYPAEHLTQEHGRFVDIIHTDAGREGYPNSVGHADFYPNNGVRPQPACRDTSRNPEHCSHIMAWKYYVETLQYSHSFIAVKCATKFMCYVSEESSTCSCDTLGDEYVHMGYFLPNDVRGDYYLTTSSEPPYHKTSSRDMRSKESSASKIQSLALLSISCIIFILLKFNK